MHTWQLAQVDQILHWAENRLLTAPQVARVEALAPLCPSRAAWGQAAERFCTVAGALLLAAAVVFFFAYNWDGMQRFAKLGLAMSALSVCVVVALASRPASLAWQTALLGASLCVGALLALIGQTYQTGADIWELFAAWTALMLPFALLARAWPTWLLCWLVSNLWVARMLHQDGALWQIGVQDEALQLALWILLNTLWWLVAWRGGRWLLATPSRHLERASATLALAALTWGALVGVFGGQAKSDFENFVLYLPLFFVVAGTAVWYYRQRRLDFAMLAVLGVCAIALGMGVLVRMLWAARSDWLLGLVVVAAFVVIASGALVWELRRLMRAQHRLALTAVAAAPAPALAVATESQS